jgi:hypothetical protein
MSRAGSAHDARVISCSPQTVSPNNPLLQQIDPTPEASIAVTNNPNIRSENNT